MPDQDEIAKFLAQDAESLVDQHARKYGVDPSFAKRILKKESALRPDVLTGGRRSRAGAIGPMQLMPGTAKELGVDPSNYEQNIEGGVKYLAQMQKQFGDPAKAAAAYNAGPGVVQKYGGVPPYAETQDYVKSVAGGDDIAEFLANDAQAAPITPAKPLTRPAKPGPIRNPQRGPIAPTANPFATNQGATGFQEQAQKAYERTQGLGQGRPQGLAEAANQFKQAALKGFARIPQGISESLQMPVSDGERRLAQTLGPSATEDIKRREGGLRRAISQATEPVVKKIEQAYPVDPNDQSWLTQKIPAGAGGLVPMIASSILGRGLGAKSSATSALSGAAQSAGEVSERLNKAGIEGPQRDKSAALAIATGATEALGLGRALDKIGAKRAIMGRLGNVAEDVAQEYGQEYLGDVNAKLVGQYDKNASLSPISPNKLEAAALGGILGGAMQGAGALASKRPGAPLAVPPVQPEPQQPLTRVDPLGVDARGKITGGRTPIQGTPRVVGTPQPSGPAQYSTRPNTQQTQITPIPTGQEYAKLTAKPEAAPTTDATAQTIPAGNLAGIRVIAEGERIPASQRRNVKTIVVKQPDGSMQSVRAILPEGMTPGQARQVLQGAQKAQAKPAPPAVAAQPTTEPLALEAPAQVNPRQAARNENIQKAHEDSIAARTQAEAARREGRHDEAIRALTVEAEALRALQKQIPDRSRGGRVRRVEAGERLTQIQSEIKAAKIAQRQAAKAADAPTADLTGPLVPDAPQTARMPEAPNRTTADLPRPTPRTTAEIPRPVDAPMTEPTNQLRNADYPGGEIPRTAGLRPEGQPVEIPAERVQENTNRLPGAEYAGGEVRTYQQPQAEGQPVDVSRRPPAPQRPAGGRAVRRGPQGQYGPTTMSAAFPRSRRGLVVEGRRVQGEIEAGRGDKGEYGKLAQSMFKSTRGDVLHGQDSFFHDADVKGALGLTRDAEQGEVRAALKTELARVMGVKSEEVSLTQVPPQAWQNWAGMKQLGGGARAKLQVAIQKYQSPILDELQKTTNPPDSSPPRPVPTDAGSTPKAPSNYKRYSDANTAIADELAGLGPERLRTPEGKARRSELVKQLRQSAKQYGVKASDVNNFITETQQRQMRAAQEADAAQKEAARKAEAPVAAKPAAAPPWPKMTPEQSAAWESDIAGGKPANARKAEAPPVAETRPRAVSEAEAAPIAEGDAGKAAPNQVARKIHQIVEDEATGTKQHGYQAESGFYDRYESLDMPERQVLLKELVRLGSLPKGWDRKKNPSPGEILREMRSTAQRKAQQAQYEARTRIPDGAFPVAVPPAPKAKRAAKAKPAKPAPPAAPEPADAKPAPRGQERMQKFDPRKHIKLIADKPKDIRGSDVWRLFDQADEKDHQAIADYLTRVRPDLSSAVAEARMPTPAEPAAETAKPAGRIDGKDVTADEMAVYDAMAKAEPRFADNAAASFSRARQESALSKEAFDKAALSLAEKEILALHQHDFPQSLSPEGRAFLVKGDGQEYIAGALRNPRAAVERAGEEKAVPQNQPVVSSTPEVKSNETTAKVQEQEAETGERRPIHEPVKTSGHVARGTESTLKIPRTGQEYRVRYEVRELSDIQPSHNPHTFEKNPDYRLVNDRDYTAAANRMDVEDATKAGVFDPRIVLSDDPTATNGPPVIYEGGDVLGGNSRAMMIARVYRNHPVDGQKYRQALDARAEMYGLDKKQLARMDQPVLVRVIESEPEQLQKLITDLNIQPGKAMSSTEAATARAKSMPPETMKFISDRLNAEGADATLAMALEGDKGVAVLNRLIDDDVIPRGDRNRYLTDAGKLSVEAKSEIETMLLSRVFRDADQMKRAAPEMKNKLVRVAPHVAKLAGTDWDIAKYIPNAIQAAAESKAQKIEIEMLNRRGHLFGEGIEYKPEELAIARWIGELTPKQLEGRFREYATAFENFYRNQGFFNTASDARESFDTIFKPARTGKEGLSFGELDREESNGPLFGAGFGALQGAFKSKPPSGADLDAWMDRMGNAIPETMTDAQISRFDDLVNRAADAAEAGNAREWKRLSRQAEQMIFTRKDRAIAEVSGAMNATRSLMASGDLSAPLRQGAILTLPPSQWGKAGRAAKRMFQALSAGKYERLKQEIQVHPDFDAAEDAGLYLATNDSGRTRGEEDFLRNNSLASRIVERMPVLAHSERAYKMYLDSLRMDTFAKYKHVIEKGGGTDEQKAKALKSAAEWINVATGRGSLGKKFDESVPLLSTIFFAPRYTASRIQVLNPATYAKNLGNPASRQVFRRQMSEMFQSAAVLTTTAALAKYGLGATVNLDDPESPDWLKIKIGDTRYDVGAGLQQIARLGARIGKYLDTSARGTEKEQGAASDKMVRAVKTFGRSKLGPVPSFFVDWLNNWTNVIGERHTPGEASTKNPIVSRITPLLWADMVDAYREGGAGKAARFTPGVFGVGVQDYDVNKKRKAETKARVRPKTPPMPGPPKGFGEL